jgi:hypothetical protein
MAQMNRLSIARIAFATIISGVVLSFVIAWAHAAIASMNGHLVSVRDDADVLVSAVRERAARKYGDMPWPKPDPADPHYECRAYGFPLRSFGAVYRLSSSKPAYPSDTSQLVCGIGLGGRLRVDRYLVHQAALPVLPLTPELVVDTVVLGIPGGAFIWWRERRRRRRAELNQCPRCGYARTGLTSGAPCPECGSPS